MHTPPRQLDAYQLKAKLAVGGYCELWLAQQDGPMGFSRRCAVKLLKPDFVSDVEARRALVAEARLIAQLHHPNLISLYTFGHELSSDTLYYAMPYLSGRSLTTLFERGAQSPHFGPPEAMWIGAQVLSGLAYAHTLRDAAGAPMRVVHRDISPENIQITYEGHVQILDFGIALSNLAARHTQTHKVKGKIPYISPEQARGEAIDHRADLYATGMMLYWMLSGREPIAGDLFTALAQARQPQIAPLHQVADVPREVSQLVMQLLHPDPRQRTSSAAEAAIKLGALLQRFAPGYSAQLFSSHVQALLAREHQQDLDFLASLSAGTAVLSVAELDEVIEEEEGARHDLTPRHTPRINARLPERTVPDLPAFSRDDQRTEPQPSLNELIDPLEDNRFD